MKQQITKIHTKKNKGILNESEINRPWGNFINLDQGNGTKYIDANLANGNSISLRGSIICNSISSFIFLKELLNSLSKGNLSRTL